MIQLAESQTQKKMMYSCQTHIQNNNGINGMYKGAKMAFYLQSLYSGDPPAQPLVVRRPVLQEHHRTDPDYQQSHH